MKILLLGEYSNVHATLAQGLRKLGHEVTVISNGDFWKNYPRDVDVSRHPGAFSGLRLYAKLLRLLPQWRGFDIVQLINPMFFELKAERLFFFYRYLRRHNRHVILGAFGMDYYWVHENITRFPLRYSDFNIGNALRKDAEAQRHIAEWSGTAKAALNQYIAQDCDLIIAGLYEYWVCYQSLYPQKTVFCPLPIIPKAVRPAPVSGALKAFIGINQVRSAYKGTDRMLRVAEQLQCDFPQQFSLRVARDMPFAQYVAAMQPCDLLFDQLYSYTPAMNALEAMSYGVVCVGGGEPESYELLGEKLLHPVINVQPDEKNCYQQLIPFIQHPERLNALKQQSIDYVKAHHDYIKVAQQYLHCYEQALHN